MPNQKGGKPKGQGSQGGNRKSDRKSVPSARRLSSENSENERGNSRTETGNA
jgi:hypothetical protein